MPDDPRPGEVWAAKRNGEQERTVKIVAVQHDAPRLRGRHVEIEARTNVFGKLVEPRRRIVLLTTLLSDYRKVAPDA